jgi:polyphosphate kinase
MDLRLPQAVQPAPVPPGAELDHPSLYFNRELGWLDFDRRVLHQAFDEGHPLLERVRFLGISASNLDEFVQKRVGGLRRLEAAGVRQRSPDGLRPSEQLPAVREAIRALATAIQREWVDELRPLLASRVGIRISSMSALDEAQRTELEAFFREHLYPILTPLAVDPGHPFPFISNLSLSLAIDMREPVAGTLHFARVKVPMRHGRWITVPGSGEPYHFVPVEEVIAHYAGELFRGMEILGVYPFRVTRNADVSREEEEAEDLIEMISEELRERRLAPVVRLEVEGTMPPRVQELLLRELELGREDLLEVSGELALEHVLDLANLDIPTHQFERWDPVVPPQIAAGGDADAETDIFSVLRQGDLLVHHPYESFSATVQRLVEAAAEDRSVLAIKQTLYRTSDDSPIVRALLRAAELGKQVAVLVEVKARFDEQNNIEWARILENAGVHVTYGLVGLKTHAKAVLVIREEGGHPRAYAHVGTGNYHVGNARVYTDLGLLTSDPEIGGDLVNLFHFLTGYAPAQPYRKLIVAPASMRAAFRRLIAREIALQEGGTPGRIVAKMNALDDPEIIRQLYLASCAGVRIELIVRGHCSLRPGLPGYSENIRVVSLIGRFLEHDRIFLFGNGGDPAVFIGSADWRGRNLDARVEAIVPITEPRLRGRLVQLLEYALADNDLAWEMGADGDYRRLAPRAGEERLNLHEKLMEETLRRRELVAQGATSR